MPSHRLATRILLAALASLFLACSTARADTLNGTSVTGTLTSNVSGIQVTKAFQSTPRTIGGGVEFTGALYNTYFQEDVTYNITADFTDSILTLHVGSGDADDNLTAGTALYTVQFTDAAFAGLQLPFSAYSCNGFAGECYTYALEQQYGVSSSTSGTTFTASFNNLRGDETYTFGTLATPTPEPSSLALLGTGMLGTLAAVKRRYRTRQNSEPNCG